MSCSRKRRCWATVALADSVSASAWRMSSADDTPASKRSLVSACDCSRVTKVRSAKANSSLSACRFSQALATEPTRLICVFLRASSVARYLASALLLSARRRPNRSISQSLMPKPTV